MTDGLHMWTIYDHPTDYPEYYVARRSVIAAGHTDAEPHAYLSKSLEGLRDMMVRMGLVCLARHPQDDPVIVETWL